MSEASKRTQDWIKKNLNSKQLTVNSLFPVLALFNICFNILNMYELSRV